MFQKALHSDKFLNVITISTALFFAMVVVLSVLAGIQFDSDIYTSPEFDWFAKAATFRQITTSLAFIFAIPLGCRIVLSPFIKKGYKFFLSVAILVGFPIIIHILGILITNRHPGVGCCGF
ncbi:MAG: hypothetical protein K8L99_35350 [Anaerolineae bacterium]|nr:hypothetical protein [Anaerolineae bacterium]